MNGSTHTQQNQPQDHTQQEDDCQIVPINTNGDAEPLVIGQRGDMLRMLESIAEQAPEHVYAMHHIIDDETHHVMFLAHDGVLWVPYTG